MIREGFDAIKECPTLWARVTPNGEIRLADRRAAIGPGTQAIRFDDGVEVTDVVLDEELVCWCVDLMAGGRQYGNRIYFRNHTGNVLRPEVFARCRVVKHPELAKGKGKAA